MAMNIGVSCKCLRIHTASKPNTPPNTKGTRHRPAKMASLLNAACKANTVTEPNKMPTDSPAVSKPLAKPTWFTGTCSDTYVHAAGTSPPIATACTTRHSNNNIGASTPTCAYMGNKPIAKVGMAINNKDQVNMRLRPKRSPRCAITKPPTGRIT